jgi:energy-coupling factor transport system permease protein
MSVFLYNDKHTAIHALDPRVKIAWLIWAFLAAALSTDLSSITVLTVIILILFIAARSMGNLLKTGWMFLLVCGMTFLLWFAFYSPDKNAPDDARAVYAGVMSLRFLAMLAAGLLFLSITRLEDFTNGLMMLKLPYAVAFAISLSFRLVNTFIASGFLIVEAQKARGNDVARGNIIRRMVAYAPLLVPLILNGIKKAETLNLALESKGFSPKNKIDVSGRYCLSKIDMAVLLAIGMTALLSIYMRFVAV